MRIAGALHPAGIARAGLVTFKAPMVGLASVSRWVDHVALGPTEQADAEATRFTGPGTYLEPFALRTLGLVRGDSALVEGSVDRFEALGLDWHAAKTRELALRG